MTHISSDRMDPYHNVAFKLRRFDVVKRRWVLFSKEVRMWRLHIVHNAVMILDA